MQHSYPELPEKYPSAISPFNSILCIILLVSHVDIPPEVEKAFQLLNSSHLGTIRTADPSFSS
jgi:hypothetical protein